MRKIIVVVMRDNSEVDPDMRDKYIGGVCRSFEEAREVVYGHRHWCCDYHCNYVENGINYAEINGETGEIVAEYFVRQVVDM